MKYGPTDGHVISRNTFAARDGAGGPSADGPLGRAVNPRALFQRRRLRARQVARAGRQHEHVRRKAPTGHLFDAFEFARAVAETTCAVARRPIA